MEWKENLTKEEYEKAIQSAQDKVRTEYVKKVKELEEKLPQEKSEREKELEQKEKELLQKENEYKVKDLLSENKLPTGLSKYLKIDDDLEGAGEEITSILNEYILNNAHQPKNRNPGNGGDAITKEQFRKMNYAERVKLEQTNAELYNKLAN